MTRGRKARSRRTLVTSLVLAFGPAHEAAARNPPIRWSSSLVAFKAGDLDRDCAAELSRARRLGFRSVALVPYVGYDLRDERIVPGATLDPGELRRCLDEIRRSGLHLLYKPHIGHLGGLRAEEKTRWRAHFALRSARRYLNEVFEPALGWLHDHRREIRQRGRWAVDLVLAHEMERSTAQQPELWYDALRAVRYRLLSSGLHRRVRVGLGVNWRPMYAVPPSRRGSYARLLRHCDFVAVSLYGDWSGDRASSVAAHLLAFRGRLRELLAPADQRLAAELPLMIGELAVGGDPRHTEREKPLDLAAVARRRQVFASLLRWAQQQAPSDERRLPIVLWTVGLFDPVGVSSHARGRRVDPAIVTMLRGALPGVRNRSAPRRAGGRFARAALGRSVE